MARDTYYNSWPSGFGACEDDSNRGAASARSNWRIGGVIFPAVRAASRERRMRACVFLADAAGEVLICMWLHMGLLNRLGNLFGFGSKKKPSPATGETAAPPKPSRAVPTGIRRPLVTPTKPGEHVAGETHAMATLIGQDAEYLFFQCLCGKKLRAPRSGAGRRVRCPVCARMLEIPS